MTLTQLRYLVAIADSGLNITQAAERVHATQPGLSKQLKALEDELGFLVYTRRGKSLERLTAAGHEVLERARRMLSEADNIKAFAENQRGRAQGDLRIVTTHTQARFVLPSALAALRASHPELSVSIEPAEEERVREDLERGVADLAILSSAGEPPAFGLAVPLFTFERIALVPRRHPLASLRRPLAVADLVRHPLVVYSSYSRVDSTMRRAFAEQGLEPTIALTARDADLIVTYVREGFGVGILADLALGDGEHPELQPIAAGEWLPRCTSYAVLPRDRVHRDHTLDLLTLLAPQLDRQTLRRALRGSAPDLWPQPRPWQRQAPKLAAVRSA